MYSLTAFLISHDFTHPLMHTIQYTQTNTRTHTHTHTHTQLHVFLSDIDDTSHVSSFGVKTEDTSGDNDNTSNLSDTDPEDDDSEPTVGWGLKIVGSIIVKLVHTCILLYSRCTLSTTVYVYISEMSPRKARANRFYLAHYTCVHCIVLV